MGQGCTGGQERVRCRECGESAEGQREEGFPGGSVVKNLPASAGDMSLIPGVGISHMLQSN